MIRCQHCNIPYNSKDLFVCCTCYNDGEECIMCPDCTQEHKEANYEMDYNIQKYGDLKKVLLHDCSDWREFFNEDIKFHHNLKE
jgi:hypothetical protein